MDRSVTDVQLESLASDVLSLAVDRTFSTTEFDKLMHAHKLIGEVPVRGSREWGGLLFERNYLRGELNRRILEPKHGMRLDVRGSNFVLETLYRSGLRKVFKIPDKVRAAWMRPVKAFIRNEPMLKRLVQEPERLKAVYQTLEQQAEFSWMQQESFINGLCDAYGIDDQGLRASRVIVFSRLAKEARKKRRPAKRKAAQRKMVAETPPSTAA